jgi:hypothetical protein
MTKAIVLIAALFAASPSFAEGVQPAAHKTGIIDTLIEQADTIRCAVGRDDLHDEFMLSGCERRAGAGEPAAAGLSPLKP